MKEVREETVSKIVGRIYRDTALTQSNQYFIKHTYTASQFENLVSEEIFHSIIGFLPNTKYRGRPFIMSVLFNKRQNNYDIIVHNPKLNY